MKKILFLLSFCFAVCVCNAQLLSFKSTGSNSSRSNTIADTNADTLDAFIGRVPALVTITNTVTRSSGTMAGKIYYYYAVDRNKAYVLCDSSSLSNAASNVVNVTKAIAAPYWRTIRKGATTVAGTDAATISAAQ